MRHKQIADQPKTFALIFDTGEEIVDVLRRFAIEKNLSGSSFKAIGALSEVVLGWFNWETKKYQVAAKFEEQVELLSLIGDIGIKDGKPQVHAHVVVGRSDGTAHGGHLLMGVVRPTCELILTESPEQMQKQIDPESGVALIRF
jgi:predicted DNA-binding protein with PD1-like motif